MQGLAGVGHAKGKQGTIRLLVLNESARSGVLKLCHGRGVVLSPRTLFAFVIDSLPRRVLPMHVPATGGVLHNFLRGCQSLVCHDLTLGREGG